MWPFDWFRKEQVRMERQKAAWRMVEAKQDDGLTLFQARCNEEMIEAFRHSPELLRKQTIEGDEEKVIAGVLPQSNIKYWIYVDGAQVGDYYLLDKLDYDTPEAMIAAFVKLALTATHAEH